MPKTKTERQTRAPATSPWVTVGTVVDTNDPQEMGRLRIMCPTLGDTPGTKITDIPWAHYVSAFGGTTSVGTRGPEQGQSSGPIAYGMWAIPKVGATAVVMCLDGDPSQRVWMGCMFGQFLPHTLPAGRYLNSQEDGPFTTTEGFIQPVYNNALNAFIDIEDPAHASPEWKTRIAEGQVAGVDNAVLDVVHSKKPDERNDCDTRQGYQCNRQRPDLGHPLQDVTGGVNADSQVYSITTPGLHTFLMDDSLKNGRIRIKTTSGNQIIMDDTNERLYISTPDGRNYIEMDRTGNIEIFSEKRISIHAVQDINFTTEADFRVSAKGIHMRAAEDFRVHANAQVNMLAGQDLTLHSQTRGLFIYSGTELHLKSKEDMFIATDQTMNVLTGSNLLLQSNANLDFSVVGDWNVVVAGQFAVEANDIQLNCGLATPEPPIDAENVDESGIGQYAYTTNRVPIGEPWGRIMNLKLETDSDSVIPNDIFLVLNMTYNKTSILELKYTDPNANKTEFGVSLDRNDKWRR